MIIFGGHLINKTSFTEKRHPVSLFVDQSSNDTDTQCQDNGIVHERNQSMK